MQFSGLSALLKNKFPLRVHFFKPLIQKFFLQLTHNHFVLSAYIDSS